MEEGCCHGALPRAWCLAFQHVDWHDEENAEPEQKMDQIKRWRIETGVRHKRAWKWLHDDIMPFRSLLVMSILSIAEGFLAAICWHDWELKSTRITTSEVSALEQMIGSCNGDGWIAMQHKAIMQFLLDCGREGSPATACRQLGKSLGMQSSDINDALRSVALILHTGTFIRFDVWYSQPHFQLVKLLSKEDHVRLQAAKDFCASPECCCSFGFGRKLKKLLPTQSAVLESAPLSVLLQGWVRDDSCISTVAVERGHRKNLDILRTRGRSKMDFVRFKATSLLRLHTAAHLRQGGQPLTDMLQRARRRAKKQHLKASQKPKHIRRPGNAMFIFVNDRLSAAKSKDDSIWPAAKCKAHKAEFAQQWRSMTEHQKEVWQQQILANRDARIVFQDETDSESDDEAAEATGPFSFGNKTWPILPTILEAELASRGSHNVKKIANDIVNDPRNDPFVKEDLSLIKENLLGMKCCLDLHPGLCATRHKQYFEFAVSLSKSLATAVSRFDPTVAPGKRLILIHGRTTVASCGSEEEEVLLLAFANVEQSRPLRVVFTFLDINLKTVSVGIQGAIQFPFCARFPDSFNTSTQFAVGLQMAMQTPMISVGSASMSSSTDAVPSSTFLWTVQPVAFASDANSLRSVICTANLDAEVHVHGPPLRAEVRDPKTSAVSGKDSDSDDADFFKAQLNKMSAKPAGSRIHKKQGNRKRAESDLNESGEDSDVFADATSELQRNGAYRARIAKSTALAAKKHQGKAQSSDAIATSSDPTDPEHVATSSDPTAALTVQRSRTGHEQIMFKGETVGMITSWPDTQGKLRFAVTCKRHGCSFACTAANFPGQAALVAWIAAGLGKSKAEHLQVPKPRFATATLK